MNAIESQGLGKRYRLGEGASYRTLRETLGSIRLPGRRGPGDPADFVWALRDVDLAVSEGDAVGLIGKNGAGKTTLLRLLARITEPTTGRARIRGRVGALLEVGTGFHPELTGRENVYLNGAVLGMGRRDTTRRFDEIAAFAGVERFLDTPLKRYSAGMYLRLAFSVAAHMEPDILVVDEVLAVGDAEFQARCLNKMSEMEAEGRTVIFVSHDLGAVARLCPRVVWLDKGAVAADGPTATVVDSYLRTGVATRERVDLPVDPSQPVRVDSLALADGEGSPAMALFRDQPLQFVIRFTVVDRTPGLDLVLLLTGSGGVQVLHEAWSDDAASGGSIGQPGTYEARLTLPPVLPADEYTVGLWLGTPGEDLFWENLLRFELRPAGQDRDEALRRSRTVQLSKPWRVTRLSEES